MPQRQSECFRKGRTDQEHRLESAFYKWTVPEIDKVICFVCGKKFLNYPNDTYPNVCDICGKKYDNVGLYCMPDIILNDVITGKKMVVFVNGKVHEKRIRKGKDRYQQTRLKELGFKIWIIKNEEIDKCRESNLLAMTKTIFDSVGDDYLYSKLLKDEKEF